MSVEQLEQSVLKLPEEERRRFLHWVDDHRHEILPDEEKLDDDMKREIQRRSAELQANPRLSQPVDSQYFDRMKRRVADVLSGKAPTV